MTSPKNLVPFVVVLVLFGMLLMSRGLGLQNIIEPRDTRIIFTLQMLLGLAAVIFLFTSKSQFSTKEIQREPDSSEHCQFFLSNQTPARTVADFLAHNSNVLAVYIFGGGTLALNFTYIYKEAQCMPYYHNVTKNDTADVMDYSGAVVQLLATLCKVSVIILEMPLLHYLTRTTHRTGVNWRTQAAILVLMGANLSVWLLTFLRETQLLEVLPHHDAEDPTTWSLRNACLTQTDVVTTYFHGSLEKVMFPFSMEFCIVALEILYHAYFVSVILEPPPMVGEEHGTPMPAYKRTLQKVRAVCGDPNVSLKPYPLEQLSDEDDRNEVFEVMDVASGEDGDNTEVLVPSGSVQVYPRHRSLFRQEEPGVMCVEVVLPGDEPRQPTKSRLARLRSRCVGLCTPLTALIFGIIEAVLIKFFLLHEELIDDNTSYISIDYLNYYCALPLIVFCIVVDGIPLLGVSLHCFCVLRQFPHERRRGSTGTHGAHRSSIVLALLGITVLTFYKMIVSAIKLHKQHADSSSETALHLFTLIESAIFLPQYYVQSLIIYEGERRLADPSNVQYSTLQGALSYIASNNFMHWAISSFLETDYLTHRMELQKDVQLWDTLVLLFIPTFIFFYFVSTFLIMHVKTMITDSGKPWQRWALTIKVENKEP